MPPFVLTVLKVIFLILLYVFVFRTIRAVALDVRGPRTGQRPAQAANPGPVTRVATRSRAPRTVVVTDERGGKPQTYRLDGAMQIGRADACEVQLADTYASSHHAKLYSRDGAWFVEDLGSTNGTYLNQRRLTAPAEVQAGDHVKIGRTVLELRR